MAQGAPLLQRVMASSVKVAARAGKIVRDVMSSGELNIVSKGKNDLQTEADRSAQRCIVASLSRQFPNVAIIGEEGSSNCEVPSDWIITDSDHEILKINFPPHLEDLEDKDLCIWVDPLDGTSEYTQGLVEHVTVLIGVAVGEKAVGGVIHQPYYKDLTTGEIGRTIWGIDGVETGGLKLVTPPEGKRCITTTRSHSDSVNQATLEAMSPDDILRVGGAGYKVLLLLEGKAHAYVFASPGCKRWDTCAPEAILHAFGGTLTDIHGERYAYNADTSHPNKRGVLATAPSLSQQHAWYLARVPNQVKQTLV